MKVAGFDLAKMGKLGDLKKVWFISEGWLSLGEKGRPPTNPPSDDPDRREVLIINHRDVETNKTELILVEMIRDGAGGLVDLVGLDAEEEAGVKKGGKAETKSPLLDAFVVGFSAGLKKKGGSRTRRN